MAIERLSKEKYAEITDFLLECPGAWTRLHDALGIEEAFKMAHFQRNEIIIKLRLDYKWTLQRIAEVLGLTRERVRQLTPAGLWGEKEDKNLYRWEDVKDEALGLAIHSPDAWNSQGVFIATWLQEKYSYVEVPGKIYKFETMLQYGLNLKTKEQQLEWIRKRYYDLEYTYSRIAAWLSERFVNISTMGVYRSCRRLGFRGHAVGRRHDLAPPPFYSETSLRDKPL